MLKHRFVWNQSIKNLSNAEKIITTIKINVKGYKSSDESLILKKDMKDWALECLKTFSGFVKTARNGTSAPILATSAKEANNINMTK